MWNRPQLMAAVSDLLFAAAAAALLVAALVGVARLPLFPVLEIQVTNALRVVRRGELEAPVEAERISTAINGLKAKHRKEVVAVINNLGASAAYMVALNADRIIAAKYSFVGSIGAIMAHRDEADSLMLIESLPSQETRNYVEKVMAGYWTYRKKFGLDTKTLDAVAQGARFVDARLDR